MEETSETMVSIGEAARMLGVSVDTLHRWERDGKLTSTRTLGGHRRFTRSEIERAQGQEGRNAR